MISVRPVYWHSYRRYRYSKLVLRKTTSSSTASAEGTAGSYKADRIVTAGACNSREELWNSVRDCSM